MNVFLAMTTFVTGDTPVGIDLDAAIVGTPIFFSLSMTWTTNQEQAQWYHTREEALDIFFSDDWSAHRSGLVFTPDNRWTVIELDIAQSTSSPDATEMDAILQTDVRKRLNDAQFDFIIRKGYNPSA